MHSEIRLSILLFLLIGLFTTSSYAAEATKKQPEFSIVLDGQLLTTKARRLGDHIYVDVEDIGHTLNWNIQNSDSTIAIRTNPSPTQTTGQIDAKLSGTITYFFNDNYGNKPDTGAKVCLIQADPNFVLHPTDTFFIALIQKAPRIAVLNEAKENSSYPIIYSSVADGSGRYEMNHVKPGKYILVIQSSHTRGADGLSVTGKVFTTSIELSSGETRDASNDFGTTSF